ncbi:AraC family transcriptional regulator [Aquabacterium sp.]|uniref:AraC family transcriptional regulator n=1 Tax=Aquabacterium sp. TaxID=1872578 RepID=UPI002489E3A7|nr:AraC family transcriptional regulator [Aquabacterium sp.]MDI1257748.1 AraC family transcriptional regulator ligand-binding domain-containing protein [Aquabacterium sp.]
MLISPIHLRVLATVLDLEGHASKLVLKACGIESIERLDDSNWVPLSWYDRLVQTAMAHTRSPHLGLTAGTSPANHRYGLHPMLAVHMPSLRQGLTDIMKFTPLLLERPEISLQETGDLAKVIISPILERGPAALFRIEFIAVAMMQMLRYGGAAAIRISGVHFSYPQPAHHLKYQAHFGSGLVFNASENAIVFNRAALDQPLPWHDRVSYLELKTRAELSLSTLTRQTDLIQRVKNVLIASFEEAPSMEYVAQQLGMSQRSLRRHLSGLGTSHTDLVKACRQLMAENRLADTAVPLKQIAGELGFSSVTCFHRAFKTWTGMTPQAWRDQGRSHGGLTPS